MSVVLDASALLAYLQREAGAGAVRAVLGDAVVSSVNWAEVVQKAGTAADEIEALNEDIQSFGLGDPAVLDDPSLTTAVWPGSRMRSRYPHQVRSRAMDGRIPSTS